MWNTTIHKPKRAQGEKIDTTVDVYSLYNYHPLIGEVLFNCYAYI